MKSIIERQGGRLVPALQVLAFIGLMVTCWPATGQAQAQAGAHTLYSQNFEGAAPGALPAGVHDDTYTGAPTRLRIIAGSDRRSGQKGHRLQAQISGFGQVVLGSPLALKKGGTYRVSLDLSATGVQNPLILLRRIPHPYTEYIGSTETVNETLRHVSFIGQAPEEDGAVGLFLVMTGFSTLTIGNIRVEEVTGPPPPAPLPAPGNAVPNAGFEGGSDGWYARGRVAFQASARAYEGRRDVRLSPEALLTSAWFSLVPGREYFVRAWVRSTGAPAGARLWLSSSLALHSAGSEQSQEFSVTPAEGWKPISFRWRVPQPQGKIALREDFFVGLTALAGDVLVDAVEVRPATTGAEEAAFTPNALQEVGLSTDAPRGVITQGRPVRVRALESGRDTPAWLEVRDESGRLWLRRPLRFRNGAALAWLGALPPGYWRLTTAPASGGGRASRRTAEKKARTEGETFVAVVPPMPNVPISRWFYGTHIIDDPEVRRACWALGLRWDRLHDSGQAAKWPVVQPAEAQGFQFHDDEIARRRTEGECLVANLDGVPGWVQRQPGLHLAMAPPPAGTSLASLADAGLPLWREYCRRVAEHWKGRIDWFEVTNEANLAGETPAQYVKLLEAARAGIKAGNPRAKVVGPAVGGPLGDGWLDAVIGAGGGRYLDAVTFHGYAQTTWGSLGGPETLQQAVGRFRGVLRRAGADPALPLWDGESGITPPTAFTKFHEPDGGSALEAARMFAKMGACARAAGLAHHFYYATFIPTAASEVGSFVLGDLNGTTRMAFQPLGVANSLLEGRAFQSEDAQDKARGVVHLVFAGRGLAVHMLWRPEGRGRVALPVGAGRLVDMWGRDIKSGQSLVLGQSPIYALVPLAPLDARRRA